ncbi:MAG TPA: ABC transporter permease [Actinomycetota bacterium]|nr:ABC transporter permease [Actinomycetota bacterium]
MSAVPLTRWQEFRGELTKLPAFMRRDFLVAWSYRMAFVTDWLGLFVQVVIFNFVGKVVDPAAIPTYDGQQPTYLEFVAVGIAISSFMAVALGRIYNVIRQEQLQGTLESLFLTPTSHATIQLGSVVYDLAYVPIRTVLFFVMVTVFFPAEFYWSGLLPTVAILVAYIPFVWGIGVMAAAWTLTFRRGTAMIGIFTTIATLGAGTYFPTDVFPTWIQAIVQYLPLTVALQGARDALLGGAGWADVAPTIAYLIPFGVASMFGGLWAFRAAILRERRSGTLGTY